MKPQYFQGALRSIGIGTLVVFLGACGGGGGGGGGETVTYEVNTSSGDHGAIAPESRTVNEGATATFAISPDTYYEIESVSGCGGTLSGHAYTTAPVTADCTVTATFVRVQYTVFASSVPHGEISPMSVTLLGGESAALTVTPDPHYTVGSVTGCNGTLSGTTYTTGPMTDDCTVTATFVAIEHTVTATMGENGTISPETASVAEGTTASFTVEPDFGFGATVTGCGGTLIDYTYTTAPIAAPCGIHATFGAPHTVTITAGANGTVTPGSRTVGDGSRASFELMPDAGYAVATATGCGGARSGTRYVTGPVTADCSVSITFDRMPFYSGQAASVVIGQPDFTSAGFATTQSSISMPYGNPVMVGGVLYLSDYMNQRLMGFNSVPTANGADADFVVAAVNFTSVGSLQGPEALAAYDGRLYVAEYDGDTIAVYSPVPDSSTTAPVAAVPQQPSFRLTAEAVGGMRGTEAVAVAGGKLVVSDSVNHRVLIWNTIPGSDTAPDLVLGQSDFDGIFRNRDSEPDATTLSYPTGLWTDGTRLVVADMDNHRVLIWNSFPTVNGQAADLVLGQTDFVSTESNQGLASPTAGTLTEVWSGIFAYGDQLFVTDTGNGRVLLWNTWPTQNGQYADAVLGKPDFTTPPGSSARSSGVLHAPSGLYFDGSQLIVGDSTDDRYLVYNAVP